MAIIHATDHTFESEKQEGLVLVDFWAPWCGPCRMIAPVLEQLDVEMGGDVKIVKINVDENPESARKEEVMSIPTLLLYKDGDKIEKLVGYQPKAFLESVLNPYRK